MANMSSSQSMGTGSPGTPVSGGMKGERGHTIWEVKSAKKSHIMQCIIDLVVTQVTLCQCNTTLRTNAHAL